MNLKEVFDQLTFGELAHLGVGGLEAGGVDPKNYDRLVAHVNLALSTLYRRFHLKEGRIALELVAGRYNYPLKSIFAVSSLGSAEAVRFIKDTLTEPFLDDIYKVARVCGDTGYEFPLNDVESGWSVFTPTAAVLKVPALVVDQSLDVPEAIRTTGLEVVYRANHPKLEAEGKYLDPEDVELELPYSHMDALLLFVASRIHTPTGMTNEANLGNIYAARYEQECQRLEQLNLQVDQGSQPDRITAKGWV